MGFREDEYNMTAAVAEALMEVGKDASEEQVKAALIKYMKNPGRIIQDLPF